MDFLHKDKKTKEAEQQELLKKIYKLGVDVGYFSHSEFGWVHREYVKLQSEAQKLGIDHLIKTYYEKGKAVGAEHKKHDISTGLGKELEKKETILKTKQKTNTILLRKKSQETTSRLSEEPTKTPLITSEKPHIADIPQFIHKIRTTALPTLLNKITPYSRR
jgi:hypothetical protein